MTEFRSFLGSTHRTETPAAWTACAREPAQDAIEIHGGDSAPGRARDHVLTQLDGRIPSAIAFDAALIISELVTNSVLHAATGADQPLTLELAKLADRLFVAVTDAGSELEPRMLPADRATPGGFGLRMVADMATAWGVQRDVSGSTRVWCELPLAPSAPA